MNQNHLSCHHIHMIPELLNTWNGPVSLFSSFPVHIAALVPQCLGLHLSLFIPCVSVFLSLSVYFCVSFFRLTLVSFPFFLSASPSIYLHVYTTPRLFLYLSVFLSFCPSFYLSVCLSFCLSENLIEWWTARSQNSKFTGGPWLRGSKSSGISIKRALIGD